MVKNIIAGDSWIELVLKRMGIDHKRVKRVVIDAQPGEPLLFYITYLGGEELLEVRPPRVDEIQIVQE